MAEDDKTAEAKAEPVKTIDAAGAPRPKTERRAESAHS